MSKILGPGYFYRRVQDIGNSKLKLFQRKEDGIFFNSFYNLDTKTRHELYEKINLFKKIIKHRDDILKQNASKENLAIV